MTVQGDPLPDPLELIARIRYHSKGYIALLEQDLFRSYGEQYDFDHLMLAALGYQESRLDQSVRSPSGAVGVMVSNNRSGPMPILGGSAPVTIPSVGITQADGAELFDWAKQLQAPLALVQEVHDTGWLPVPMFCAGGDLASFAELGDRIAVGIKLRSPQELVDSLLALFRVTVRFDRRDQFFKRRDVPN